MSTPSPLLTYETLQRNVEEARVALSATRWWQVFKHQEAASKYKTALLMGALWEIENKEGATRPLGANGQPIPEIEVPPFEPGHGRVDLDMLYQTYHALAYQPSYQVRENLAYYLKNRPDDTGSAKS